MDWECWEQRGDLTPDQCECVAKLFAEGWHPEYLALDEQRSGGLTLAQLRQICAATLATPQWAFDRQSWLELANVDPAAAGRSSGWAREVARVILAQGRLVAETDSDGSTSPQRDNVHERSPARISPREMMKLAEANSSPQWVYDLDQVRKRLDIDGVLPAETVEQCLQAVRERAEQLAWAAAREEAQQRSSRWLQQALERACRRPQERIPLVCIVGATPQSAVAVAICADGECLGEQLLDLADSRNAQSQIEQLLDLAGATRLLLQADSATTKCVRILDQLARRRDELRWQQVCGHGGSWWSTSVRAATLHRGLSASAREALYIGHRHQAPVETLAELPVRELAPPEFAGLLSEQHWQQADACLDAMVHECGLDLRRSGPRAIARLCAISPLHAQRAQPPAGGWESLEQFRAALRLNDQQWLQTHPFIRLGAEDDRRPLCLACAPPFDWDQLWRSELCGWDRLKPGQTYTGVVLRAATFGLFVDIGAETEVLLHISEMSARYLSDPLALLAPGDTVVVELTMLDEKKHRVAARLLKLAYASPDFKPKSSRHAARPAAAPEQSGKSKVESKPATARPARGGDRKRTRRKPAQQAGKPRRRHATPAPSRRATKSSAPPPPLTPEMEEGKAPLRSFSDLVQFYDRKKSQEDSHE
ncbi:MAG: S1 RNA-binding domain-containing protein [Planctomycetales bacterium]|nr:S1 RNA-binding domain-containing protein [Planctomycetales bacterium]